MELDLNILTICSLITVIVMLIVYIAWRFREERAELTGLQVDDLLGRLKESERLLQTIRDEPCWVCGSKDKDVKGDLFGDNKITITCRKCGTETIWTRGKSNWTIQTQTRADYINKLRNLLQQKSGVVERK